MKFFIDTADIEEIRKANSLGFLDGVTTNPTLIAKTKRPFMEVVKEILSEVPDKPVSLEVASTDYQGMVRRWKVSRTWKKCSNKNTYDRRRVKSCKILWE